MKLNKFLCLFLLIAAVFALASCDILLGSAAPQEEVKEYKITFDSRGGDPVAPQNVKEGGYITEPKEPTREGYKFEGWYLSGKKWDFATKTVSRDTTLTAKWSKVSTHEHNFTGATCTQPGQCSCGQIDSKPLGHTMTPATCSAPATCSVCGATEGSALPHTPVTTPGTDATCTTEGKTEGKHCSVCSTVLEAQTTIPALGHKPGAEATCTEAQTCTVCNVVINPALGHNEVIDSATEPGCETTGLTEGKHCDRCGTTLVEQEEVPALGHDWDDGKVTVEPDCVNTGVKTYTCKNDPTHTKTSTVDALGHSEVIDEKLDPGCETTGLTEGKHCSVCEEILVKQEVVPAAGHKWENGECSVCHKKTSHTVNYYIGVDLVYSEEFTEAEGLESLYVYTKNGYNFLGWSDGIDTVTSIPAGTTEDIDLYGDIEAIEYTITYIVDGETFETVTYTISDNETTLIAAPDKSGYTVAWVDENGQEVTSLPANHIGNVTLTANYTEITYKVSYELNGGKNDERNTSEYSLAALPELYAPESRDGYLFQGWYLDSEFSGEVVTSFEDLPASDVTLYAKWSYVGGGTVTPEAPF